MSVDRTCKTNIYINYIYMLICFPNVTEEKFQVHHRMLQQNPIMCFTRYMNFSCESANIFDWIRNNALYCKVVAKFQLDALHLSYLYFYRLLVSLELRIIIATLCVCIHKVAKDTNGRTFYFSWSWNNFCVTLSLKMKAKKFPYRK